ALIRRITPRECLSPPFMAAFMSSVSCCFRLMDHLLRDRECRGRGWNPGTQKAGHARACRLLLRYGRPGPPSGSRVRSVQALTLGDVARGTAQLALHGSCGLALAFLGRLFVELALAGLGQHAGLFAGALEAAERKLERFVLADFDAGHGISGTQ